MTEAEWLACDDPVQLLAHLNRPQDDRKLFLFALACCRAIWPLLPQREMREGVEVAERFAEGLASKEELDAADYQLEGELYGGVEYFLHRPSLALPEEIAGWVTDVQAIPPEQLATMASCGQKDHVTILRLFTDAGYFADHVLMLRFFETHDPTQSRYPQFLSVPIFRDVFGNPFRPIIADTVRRSATVVKLAETIYTDRTFDRLPILADALEEAGCTNADILGHCRGPGPHVRGCWVVDLLTGRQ